MRNNKLALVGLLETREKQLKAANIRSSFGSHWMFVDNYNAAYNGRIWVGWDTTKVQFRCISSTDQTIHGEVILQVCFSFLLLLCIDSMMEMEGKVFGRNWLGFRCVHSSLG